MPLDIGLYGTNQDGSVNLEYCKYCFEGGKFRDEKMTLDDAIGQAAAQLVDEKMITQEDAERTATEKISNLKRWKK